MDFRAKIISEVNVDDWNNMLKKENYATAFQTANYYKPDELVRNCKTLYIIVTNNNEEIVGQLVALLDLDTRQNVNKFSRFLINKLNLGTKIIWDYGPIIHDKHHQKEIVRTILKMIDRVANEYNVEMIRGSSCPLLNESNEEIFESFEYKCRKWSTYIVDLKQNPEQYYDKLNKKIKYDIRKAEKNKIEFQIAEKRKDLDEFTSLKASLRGRNPPEEYSNFERDFAWDVWYKSNIRKLFLVKHNGKVVGGINANEFNRNLIQTSVVNIQPELNGGTFLTWNTINWAMKMGQNTFDLGGVNPNPASLKEKDIDFYKSKWKGKKYHNVIFLKVRKPKKRKISSIVMRPSIVTSKIKNILKNE